MSDTIDLALGRDRGIMVKRNKLKQEDKVKNLSSEKVRTITWELEIRNNKTGPIDLVLQDHIPVTQNEDIKISLLDNDGANHTEIDGKLEWKIELDAKSQKKLTYVYSVMYNKDKTLAFQ
jgi:predicted secreted protein